MLIFYQPWLSAGGSKSELEHRKYACSVYPTFHVTMYQLGWHATLSGCAQGRKERSTVAQPLRGMRPPLVGMVSACSKPHQHRSARTTLNGWLSRYFCASQQRQLTQGRRAERRVAVAREVRKCTLFAEAGWNRRQGTPDPWAGAPTRRAPTNVRPSVSAGPDPLLGGGAPSDGRRVQRHT